MILYTIHKAKLTIIAVFFAILPFGCTAIPENTISQDDCSNTGENPQKCPEISRIITEGNIVKMRVKVYNKEGNFNPSLQQSDFSVETISEFGREKTIQPTVILPTDTRAETTFADVIIMLDMSGSMKFEDSSPGRRRIKFKGAIDAINGFIDAVNDKQNLDVRIGLAPFGQGGNEFTVTDKSLDANFYPSDSDKLKEKVEELANQYEELDASTNLYEPLETAVEYLRNSVSDSNNTTNNSQSRQLVVIVLSDGFHNNDRPTEEQQFEILKNILQPQDSEIPKVKVHTLGYGESLKEVYNSSECDIELTEEQLTEDEIIIKDKVIDQIINNCRYPRIRIDQLIVDQPRLKQIADLTGGSHQFPDNAEEVAQSLIKFLESLQEYQLEYEQPEGDRATKHQAKVLVKGLTSNAKNYRITNIGYGTLKPLTRALLTLGALVGFGLIGVFPFIKWSEKLRAER
ncbi:vWA domain-containing protein [Okeania sp. KiyG1]|uniref:vWA domain-containing protein n=1 Tax=Okeania sp. KiyG1 TaxID=2720165 RepID=UPI001923C1E7|nr:vWA domain-containing protein [Okeania sp. KiyG1]GGA03338.1 hypothetical protein CYANOKiyG1_15480 [Okeania sp. KiyG1]